MNTKYRQPILDSIKNYLDELNDNDFSHDINHIFRVERMAKRIAKEEGADIEIIEASCLLFDIAREMEDKGVIEDHAEEAVEIAKEVLPKIKFPNEKIDAVCHAIISHRRSKNRVPKTLEAKILRDADYLDAMGAIDVARVISSSLISEKYRRPIFVEGDHEKGDTYKSAIHFLYYKLNHPKHSPENFFTKMGKEIAKERYAFMKEYAERFVDEWYGKR